MNVMSLTSVLTLMIAMSFLFSPIDGISLSQRIRGERARRQGYTTTELERQKEIDQEQLFTEHPQKPEVPTLYAIPRGLDQLPPSEESLFDDSETLNNQGNDRQVTTTEVNNSYEESSQPLKGVLEEGVSEDYQLVTVTQSPSDSTSQSLVTVTTEPLIRNLDDLNQNGIKILNGYSAISPSSNSYDSRIRANLRESGGDVVTQEPRVNFIGNYIPPSSVNEIPKSHTSRPIDQQQVENSYHQHQQQQQLQLQRYQHPRREQEAFEQFAALNQPTRNQYEQRQESEKNQQGHGGYQLPQQQAQNFQRFDQGIPQSIGNDQKTNNLNTNMIDTTDGMSLEGLGTEIVDAKLLQRVQQIIEDHERQRKEYLFRLQQNQAQLPTNSNQNGNTESMLKPDRDYSEKVKGMLYSGNTTPQMGRSQDQQTTSPQYNSQQGVNFFRETKSFPGNSNLEFQPAILTGHFVETKTERLREESSEDPNQYIPIQNQNIYLPPNQKSNLQNGQPQQQQGLTQNYYPRSEQSDLRQQQYSQLQNSQQQQYSQIENPQQQQQYSQPQNSQQQQYSQTQNPQQQSQFSQNSQQQQFSQTQNIQQQQQYSQNSQQQQFSQTQNPQQQQQHSQNSQQQEYSQTQNPQQQQYSQNSQQQQYSQTQNPQQQQQQYSQSQNPQQQQQQQYSQSQNPQQQQQYSQERFHQSDVQTRPYNSSIPEIKTQFPLETRMEEGFRSSPIMSQGYEDKRAELKLSFLGNKMENVESQNYIGGRQTQNPYFHNLEKSNEKGNGNSLERFHVSSTEEKKESPEYLPPKHGEKTAGPHSFEPSHFYGREANSIRGNPNVITRTIVIHETPVGVGNPEGLTNRALIRVSDLEPKDQFQGSIPTSILPNYNQPIVTDGNPTYQQQQSQQPQQQFQFLAASANLRVREETDRPRNTVYNTLPSSQYSQNSESFEQDTEVEKPRPVYGIPIAPVLGPDSISDSVVIDAAQANGVTGSNHLNIGKDGSTDQNVFALYRLPSSNVKSLENGDPRPSVMSFDGDVSRESNRPRGGAIPSTSYGVTNVITKRNVRTRFSPALVSPLAGFFTLKTNKF